MRIRLPDKVPEKRAFLNQPRVISFCSSFCLHRRWLSVAGTQATSATSSFERSRSLADTPRPTSALEFGVWSLEFIWSLELGPWSLVFGAWSLVFGAFS